MESNKPYVVPTFIEYVSSCQSCFCFFASNLELCFRWGLCSWIPPNSLCTSADAVSKIYYDRGAFDRQLICFHGLVPGSDPVFTGPASAFSGPGKYICCCIDCPDLCNEMLECSPVCCCGESISIRPCTHVAGCPLQSCWLLNCCGLCGLKDGEPLCLQQIPGGSGFAVGEGEKAANAINSAYGAWNQRVMLRHVI